MDDLASLQDTLAALRNRGIEVFDVEIIGIAPGFSATSHCGFFEASAHLGTRCVLVARAAS